MRLATLAAEGRTFVAARRGSNYVDLSRAAPALAPDMITVLAGGAERLRALAEAAAKAGSEFVLDPAQVRFLPPVPRPGKIICVGLNYQGHIKESGFPTPDYPTMFPRFVSSLAAHRQPLVRPEASEQFDYEGEFVAVIGKGGRHISREGALAHVAGYSIFNDGSLRDYQFKAPQWTMGKNFDITGAFGPEIVTADELPAGAAGLKLETRFNGQTVQSTNTSDLLFDVASLIATISEGITLETGDIIVTGTPSGVGASHKPPLWMKPGDRVEVEVEGIGILENHVVAEEDVAVQLDAA